MKRPSFLLRARTRLSPIAGRIRRLSRHAWRGVREWCGDTAYERYLSCARKRTSGKNLLSPAQFYVEQLNRRYSRPNRCC